MKIFLFEENGEDDGKKGEKPKCCCYTINNESGLSLLQHYKGESEFCALVSEEILIFLKLFRKEISLQFSLTLSTKMMKRMDA